MRIGILGSGLMGARLGTIFARAGHDVVFSYARDEDKLKKLARDAQGNARAGTPEEAAKDAAAILLAVHWSRIDDVLKQADDLSGKVVVTCSLPMNADNTKLILGTTTSGAEELAKKVPGAHVVCAFNTVPSEVLPEARTKAPRPSLVYCGDDSRSKGIAAQLIRDAGFDPVDAGPLRIARYTQPFALLLGQLAYQGEEGPELAYRFERFGEISVIMPELVKWDSFYVIVGSAAGALIGLQFVVLTLIAERPIAGVEQAAAAFGSPTVVHFAAALFLAALAHVPWPTITIAAIFWGLVGFAGVVYEVIVVWRMRKQSAYDPVFEDWLFHCVLPFAAYATLAGSSFAASSHVRGALFGVGAAAILLLFIGIHNAWDSVSYHVLVNIPKKNTERRQDESE